MTYLTEKRFRIILNQELDQKLDEKLDEKLDQKFEEKLKPYATREETEIMMEQKLHAFGQDLIDVFATKDEIFPILDSIVKKLDILLQENTANTSAHERMWKNINKNTEDIKLLKEHSGLR